MSDNISKNILGKIKHDGIKPRPRWQFALARVMLIIALVMAIITGGLVMSIVLLKLNNLDWEFVSLFGEKGAPRVFEVLPLVWIALLIIILWLVTVAFEKTGSGYKYSPGWVVLGAIMLSTSLAGTIYLSSATERFEEAMRSHLPFYEAMENQREARFNLPEMGILPGRILTIQSRSLFELVDLRENVWEVEMVPPLADRMAGRELKAGQMIFAVGRVLDGDHFRAEDLRFKKGVNVKMMMQVVRKGKPLPPPPVPVQ